jgi:hypothetical protein
MPGERLELEPDEIGGGITSRSAAPAGWPTAWRPRADCLRVLPTPSPSGPLSVRTTANGYFISASGAKIR